MEEYTSYIFQVVCLLIVAVIVLSLCLLGCFKSVKNVRSTESANEGATDVNQVEETSDERDVGGHRGHERALPEIPPTLTRVGTSVDDDEEEDDSIYDIISKGKRAQPCIDNQINLLRASSSSSSMPGQNKTKTRKKQHPYEKVGGDTDGDSSTYGPPSRDPLYAGIKDVLRKGEGDVDDDRASATTNQVTISMPSPDIFYVGADNAENSSSSRFSASFIQNHSPLLPPRNFPDFTNSSEPSNHFPGNDPNDAQGHEQLQHIPPIQDNLWTSNTFIEQPAESTVNNQSNVAEAATSDDNRVPNYSSVTARESLNNLRKRGQLLLRDNPEEMYDTINYDAIKRASTVLSSDHVYCTTGSDLYAEIATGHSSSRSSTYARVSDVLPRANSNFSLTGQPQTNNSTTDPRASRSSAFDDTPSSSSPPTSTVRSFCNSEFPIYSVVNKPIRPKTYLDSVGNDNAVATSLRKSCIEVAPPFRSVDEFHQPSAGTNQTFLGGSEPTRPKDARSKIKSEHGYSKIVFNKRNNSNQKSSESSTNYSKEKYEASIYDCVDEDSLYESVPVDLESRVVRVPNQMKVRTTDKIRLPWKDKHKKSNEELRRDNDVKKTKLLNGYHNAHSLFLNHISGGLNGTDSKFDVPYARKSTNCNSLPKFEWGRHSTSFEKNCESSTLGKSRFYVTSEILPEENDHVPNDHHRNQLPNCSSKLPIQSGLQKAPIREHIYELVKDAAYIDDDDDEDGGVVLESDV